MVLQKSVVFLGGIPLAATGSISWKFITGVHPYISVFQVHEKGWKRLKGKKGQALTLTVTNSYGKTTTIKDLYILEEVPSSKPHLVSFQLADKRWKWDRKLITRDYNLSKKTGDKNFDNQTLPVDNKVITDKYDYRPFSLQHHQAVWTAEECLKDVLTTLMAGPRRSARDPGGTEFSIDSLGVSGEFTIQNISLSDPGNMALQRVLAFIPGASVWVDSDGIVRVFNNMDTTASDNYLKSLPPSTWDGEKHELVERKVLRPNSINVYYDRELEAVVKYEDDYDPYSQQLPDRDGLWCENVIPTVFEETDVRVYDYDEGKVINSTVPPGTWIPAKEWLRVHDILLGPNAVKGALPWTFETLRIHWIKGTLETVLVGSILRGENVEDTTNALQAIQVLRENFRQTFRISRRYMECLRGIKNIRVALLDPVTGARMPASVWGEMTVALTHKGTLVASRKNKEKAANYYKINAYPDEGQRTISKDPGPQRIVFTDEDVGIFRLITTDGTYGTYRSLIPGFTVGKNGKPNVPIQDLGQQDDQGVSHGAGMRLINGTMEFLLPEKFRFLAMVTVYPGAPNNEKRCHKQTVNHDDLSEMFDGRVKIEKGNGPSLDIFIPAGEMTARYAWVDDKKAEKTLLQMLGLDQEGEDTSKSGIEENGENPPGFVMINEQREIRAHSRAVAAEAYSHYLDATAGRVSTRTPDSGKVELVGNMSGASIQISGSPSSKVRVLSEFAGRVNPVSRLALMPESARKVVLGIVRFK